MQLLYVFSYLITAFINAVLGAFVFFRNPHQKVHQAFAAFILGVVLWIISLFLFYAVTDEAFVLAIGRFNFAAAIILVYFLFVFTYTFPTVLIRLSPLLLRLLTVETITLSLITVYTPLVDEAEIINGASRTTVYGPLYAVFLLHFLSLTIASCALLYLKFKRATGVERAQIRLLILGISVSFLLASITNIFIPLFTGYTDIQNIGPLATIALVSCIAYAIVKHRFLDIHLIVARTISYALLVSTISLLFALNSFLIQRLVFHERLPPHSLVISTLVALGLAFLYQPLRRFWEKNTDFLFYKQKYDANTLLRRLSNTMATHIDFTSLLDTCLHLILTQMHIHSGTVVLLSEERIIFTRSRNRPPTTLTTDQITLLIARATTAAENGERLLIYDETGDPDARRVLADLQTAVFIPLFLGADVAGALLLGQKLSGDVYSSDDITLLKIIAPELAVAVSNAMRYEESKRFNVLLEEKVKEATEELRTANAHLREMDKLKDEFLYMAQHELRTPLTIIKSNLHLIAKKQADTLSLETKRGIDRSLVSTERLITIVNKLLTVSQIGSKKLLFSLGPVDLSQVILQVCDDVAELAREKQIAITVTPLPQPCVVHGDRARLYEVVLNLVDNALKFTPTNGVVTLSAEHHGAEIWVTVTDTGPGIPQAAIPKLFQKFGRLGNSYTRQPGESGTGLGLYIVKQIIEKHGGRIWVTPTAGKGTTFTFSLPVDYKAAKDDH
jgi:signal transduction histidine kinase